MQIWTAERLAEIKPLIEEFAVKCRQAIANYEDRPILPEKLRDLSGINLRRANLSGANLRRANLRRANLSGADLRRANLSGANLSGADLSGADLRRANLSGANLSGANLSRADLSRANLSGANLSRANLSRANLSGANLSRANLSGANLSGADLSGADLSRAIGSELAIARTRILPEGAIILWKKCKNNVIVKLLVPAESPRSHAFGRKCRVKFADPMEVFGAEFGVSLHDDVTEYRVGQRVMCDVWDEDWRNECSGGIHGYITRIEAENHS